MYFSSHQKDAIMRKLSRRSNREDIKKLKKERKKALKELRALIIVPAALSFFSYRAAFL
jgi:uncharacterized membrane protein (DUF106 family)